MKTKKFTSKLILNKNTIANLDFKALQNVKAGGPEDSIPVSTIPICSINCCTQNTSVLPGACC